MHKDYFGAIGKVDVIGLIKSLVVPDQVQLEGQGPADAQCYFYIF